MDHDRNARTQTKSLVRGAGHAAVEPDAIEGEHQGALKVRLTAPPVDDRANQALRQLLADDLKVSASAVRIVAGEKSRTKRVEITGVTRAQVTALVTEK
jgi:uncharacterized protein (TIGR00251 family)